MRISDWSSDVCSSDLYRSNPLWSEVRILSVRCRWWKWDRCDNYQRQRLELSGRNSHASWPRLCCRWTPLLSPAGRTAQFDRICYGSAYEAVATAKQIGRASCRERVGQYV